ncbi:hypothetical protein WJX73_010821 [Symbiochloris irregularis]|uniref:Uncharacterized protein n=1 Tax=Symbiochloris irregularis TaxID=706552 RepID=A0AAW1NST7_9CHLO
MLATRAAVADVEVLLPGMLQATEEVKISQVRKDALNALQAVIAASEGGSHLSAKSQTSIREALGALVKREQNILARTKAQQLLSQLHLRGAS